MRKSLKTGLIGVGHLGRIHLKQLLEIPEIELTGIYDADTALLRKLADEYSIKAFETPEALIEASEAVDIVTPTSTHYFYARQVIRAGKHLFIEKPITETVSQAEEIVSLSEEARVKVQVGHVERYNPAFLKAKEYNLAPRFIEAHRLAAFSPRGTDVSVIMDLMIHDIDIALHIVNAPVQKISASAVAVISDTPDIANARITFDNGSVANLTASRISFKKMRKMRLFQQNAYISLDFLERKLEVVNIKEANAESDPARVIKTEDPDKSKEIHFDHPETKPVNAIYEELKDFAKAVLSDKPVSVSADEACQALYVAQTIQEKVEGLKLS